MVWIGRELLKIMEFQPWPGTPCHLPLGLTSDGSNSECPQSPSEPCPRLSQPTCNDVVQEGGGHAEEPHQQVTDSQVQDEQVGDRAHVLAPQDDETNPPVAHHAEEEDEEVGGDEDSGHRRLVEVEVHVGDIAFQVEVLVCPIVIQRLRPIQRRV